MGGKTRLQMRSDMATDLKITEGTELTAAELNRGLERAVADLSRFLPREKIYEESLQFAVTGEEVTMPVDTDVDRIVTSTVLTSHAAGYSMSIAGQPDVPRVLTITINDANISITGMTFIVQGTDRDDLALTEHFHFTFGMHVAGESTTLTGKKEFKTVRTIEINQLTGSWSGDTVTVGVGAYTDVWVSLANKPVKWGSERDVTDVDANALARNTDFYIDYMKGRIKAISGGDIVASDTVTISYTKGQLWVDISALADFIRVDRVEYPVGQIPQTLVQHDVWGDIVTITGGSEQEEQGSMAEDKHIRVYYSAEHQPPTEYSPGSVPEFLENTILMAAEAYALFTYASKQEVAAETRLASAASQLSSANSAHTLLSTAMTNIKKYLDNNSTSDAKTSLASANGDHSAFGTALTNLKKYLDNNNTTDAAGLLDDINNDTEALRLAIAAALDAANAYLDLVANDITVANAVRAKYIETVNYVDGGTEPDILAYLTSGDALLNTVAVGGESTEVMEAYRRYAETVSAALVGAFERDRAFYIQNATARTNAALAYVQEAAQRLSEVRSYIERSAGYATISSLFGREAEARVASINTYLRQAEGYATVAATFAREAEDRIATINAYVAEAAQYVQTAGGYMALADRFRAEAIERRNEVYSIWRDRRQYIGDYVQSSMKQLPSYNNR